MVRLPVPAEWEGGADPSPARRPRHALGHIGAQQLAHLMHGVWFRVQGVGFGVWGLKYRV